jgi:glycosyltransferase involved in cell wall biosynthesis
VTQRRVLVNAVSAKMGGAANYVEALAGTLGRIGTSEHWTFIVPVALEPVVRRLLPGADVVATSAGARSGTARQMFDQWTLRELVRTRAPHVLFSTGNVALLGCRCRQMLLVRNALFFSVLYRQEIQPVKNWRTRAGEAARRTAARLSVRAADVVLTPSHAMRDEMVAALPEAAAKTIVNPYGVDGSPSCGAQAHVRPDDAPWRLLFGSLYAEHKNVGTLLDAVARLAARGVPCVLHTPADPRPEAGRNSLAAGEAMKAERLAAAGLVQFTGTIGRYGMAAQYAEADVAVYPSVVESFGHPLLESMAAGLPVVAADVPINREIGGDAALYFSPFDAGDCAAAIERVLLDPQLRSELRARALARAATFTWAAHVRRLEQLAFSPNGNQ